MGLLGFSQFSPSRRPRCESHSGWLYRQRRAVFCPGQSGHVQESQMAARPALHVFFFFFYLKNTTWMCWEMLRRIGCRHTHTFTCSDFFVGGWATDEDPGSAAKQRRRGHFSLFSTWLVSSKVQSARDIGQIAGRLGT